MDASNLAHFMARRHRSYGFLRHPLSPSNMSVMRPLSAVPPNRAVPVKAWPLRILVTGFGGFPGTRDNPATRLIRALGAHKARLARLGIVLELDVLPVNYAEVAEKLEALNATLKPDAILHFGLAPRRKYVSIETRALNRVSLLHCDASGARARHRVIVPGAPHAVRSTFPTRQIAAAFCRAGYRARLSSNAGNYVCNETFYHSLIRSPARSVGFIHVPRLARPDRPLRASRCRRENLAGLTRAALIAILVTAPKLRQTRAPRFCE
jgi:pyroglutamyl-peptidase